jgi:hypothetical protein
MIRWQSHLSGNIKCTALDKGLSGSVLDKTVHSSFFYLLNLLKRTDYMMQQQFNIQQLYVLPTLYLCVLYLSENKQRLVPITS